MGVNRNQSPGMAQNGGTNVGLTGIQGKNGKTAGNYSRNKQTPQQQLAQSRNAPPGSGNRGQIKNSALETASGILGNTGAVNRTTHSDQNLASGVPSVLLDPGRHAAYRNSPVSGYHPYSVNSGSEVSVQRRETEQNEQIGKTLHPAVSDPNANSEQTASRTLGSTDTFSEDGMNEEEGVFGTKRKKWIPKQNHNLNGHTRKWEVHNTVIPKTDLENDDCKLEFVESDEEIFQLGLDEVLEEEKSFCLMGRFAGRFPGMRHVIQMVRSWKMECTAEYESNEHAPHAPNEMLESKSSQPYCLKTWKKPMFMDKFTYEQQKRDFARILVDMDCSIQPVETVSFKMPDGALWNQHLIFENLPPYCSRCGSEIHLTALMPINKSGKITSKREKRKRKKIRVRIAMVKLKVVEQSEEEDENRAEDDSESDGMSTEYEDMSEEAALERLKILKGGNHTCKKAII
nr:uncharacterized protein LOC109172115 [Ipomoea batatas]